MRTSIGRALLTLPAALLLAPAAGAGAPVADSLSCLAPSDAPGIDAVLARAESPLAGTGATFVAEAEAAGLDPRFLVAVAAHETLLETYPPAQVIRNPFGIGPGWTFRSERLAIRSAAQILARYYLAEGRATVATIGAKWAPLGVLNDPGRLNDHWPAGVARYYALLGGDPERPVTLAAQDPRPACLAPIEGPPVVTVWDGRSPTTSGPAIYEGTDPATGLPATIDGFVFPLAPPAGVPVVYEDEFARPGAPASPGCFGNDWFCAITLHAAQGTQVVASAGGTLHAATADEQLQGIGFWLETAAGDRIAYGPLGSYEAGVTDGAAVLSGQALGRAASSLLVAWERDGLRINPYPLLSATRAAIR